MEPTQAVKLHGYLLEFPEKEFEEIKTFLSYNGYAQDSDGLRECIRDVVKRRNGSEKKVGAMLGDLLYDNHQMVGMGIDLVSGAIKTALSKKRGR